MASELFLGPDGGPYVSINENSNDLELQDINGNVIAKWDETVGEWDLNNNSLTNIDAINAGSASVGSVNADEVSNTGREIGGIETGIEDGAWSWFHEPRAVHYSGKTYFGSISKDGDVVVASKNHETGAVTTNTLTSDFEADDHNNPTLIVANDGRIWVTYSKHNSEAQFYYHVSTNAGDISSFGSQQTVSASGPGDVTYPSPVQYSDGTIDVFYRSKPAYMRARSTDGGSTWTHTQIMDETHYIKPYQDGDVVHFGIAGPVHPRNRETDVSYFRYEYGSGFFAADGSSLSPSFTISGTNPFWDGSSQGDGWVWDCAPDENGNPVVLFATYPSVEHHEYRYAKYAGGSWTVSKVTDGGGYITNDLYEKRYSPGMCLDREDPSRLFAAIGDNQSSKIQRWETNDGGESWSYTDIIGAQGQNVRPVVPHNRHKDLKLMWMRGSYSKPWQRGYHTSIAYSDGDPTTSVDQPSTQTYKDGFKRVVSTSGRTVSSGNWRKVQWDEAAAPDSDIFTLQFGGKQLETTEWGIYQISASVTVGPLNQGCTVMSRIFVDGTDGGKLGETVASSGETVTHSGSVQVPISGHSKRIFLAVQHDSGVDEPIAAGDGKTQMDITRIF